MQGRSLQQVFVLSHVEGCPHTSLMEEDIAKNVTRKDAVAFVNLLEQMEKSVNYLLKINLICICHY